MPLLIFGVVSVMVGMVIAGNRGGITEALADSRANLLRGDPRSRQRVIRLYRAIGVIWTGVGVLVAVGGVLAMVML
ncbi:hypothetical protein F0L17_16175 [Streptomyces sp. TRM43335]|uniref:Uncharacterized protein n=1 Tax=Streptomyces taklimakanensis TaxID=2569853 RepID=A0A6G2BEQ9_9ACTN|nr:hypothetical protein [Streptomyces taklimakanensis]MTE20616.1 hypothetical protein [Streptomyces taklimakanensis]